ncbi:7SK snRNA methylphosphate capping enzyme-like [Neocloeon triangulifer]|uniref:7SK snRNA methylphosphate capping enzyme-like n=1 Tax=Neocloeon triangulifer TaxID=2078957 RepID=UPI00286F4EC6|nr:7SK snRNA methylphosphate capping enzyme-like [Neocloeon triangulifer]
MASTDVERLVSVEPSGSCTNLHVSKLKEQPRTSKYWKKKKPMDSFEGKEPGPNDFRPRNGKKRSYSGGKHGPMHKKHKRNEFMKQPTKFLLGGNIHDPLNLQSLQDAEINRIMNAVTPQSSPLPTPKHRKEAIEVLIPPDIYDPLNLKEEDPNYELELISPKKEKKRKRKRRLSLVSPDGPQAKTPRLKIAPAEKAVRPTSLEDAKPAAHWKPPPTGKIVSPVIPQPGGWSRKLHKKVAANKPAQPKKQQSTLYQFGNYDRYYGYRLQDGAGDLRLKVIHQGLIQGKDVLDIGCNSGQFTMALALYGANSVVGLEIDTDLVKKARENKRLFVRGEASSVLDAGLEKCLRETNPTLDNLIFVDGDYVLSDEEQLAQQKQAFDVITCMSVTKWMHLNHGDDGLKRAFKRMYAQLRPGGVLIMEPQSFKSYKLKKAVTAKTLENFNKIKLFPNKFTDYLLSAEVGFAKAEVLGVPSHHSKGFQRPILMFTKAEVKESSA